MTQRRSPVGRGAVMQRTLSPDVDHVAVLDDVVAALDPQRPPVSRARVAAGVEQLVPGDDLGADERLLNVAVDTAGGGVDTATAAQGVRLSGLVGVRGEEADEVEQVEGRADQPLEAGALDA